MMKTLVVVGLGLGLLGCGVPSVGESLPPELSVAGQSPSPDEVEPVVFWLFRTEDCLRCESLAQRIRQARADGLEFTFVPVLLDEDSVPTAVENFFLRERLGDPVVVLSDGLPTRWRGLRGSPLIVTAKRGRVSAVLVGDSARHARVGELVR